MRSYYSQEDDGFESVNSSNVEAIKHDKDKNELHVKFKSGQRYAYENVPQQAVDALKSSPSIGSHIAVHFNKKYQHRKLT